MRRTGCYGEFVRVLKGFLVPLILSGVAALKDLEAPPASLSFESAFEQYNPFIHKVTDTLAQSGGRAEHALKFAKLGAACAVELAK